MGIYRSFVSKAQGGGSSKTQPTSEKILTPANVLTASRPIIGGIALANLIKGKGDGTFRRSAFLVTALGAATDMEGVPARLVDKRFPNSGRGSTVHGQKADPLADTIFAAEVAAGVVGGKNTSMLAKLSAVIIAAKESRKTKWYVGMNDKYANALAANGQTEEKLVIPVDNAGKEAMVEEMIGLGLAVATADLNKKPLLRTALGLAAIGHAVVAFTRGEQVLRHYDGQATEMIDQVSQGTIPDQAAFGFDPMPQRTIFSRRHE